MSTGTTIPPRHSPIKRKPVRRVKERATGVIVTPRRPGQPLVTTAQVKAIVADFP